MQSSRFHTSRLRMRWRQIMVVLPAVCWALGESLALWRARRRSTPLRPN